MTCYEKASIRCQHLYGNYSLKDHRQASVCSYISRLYFPCQSRASAVTPHVYTTHLDILPGSALCCCKATEDEGGRRMFRSPLVMPQHTSVFSQGQKERWRGRERGSRHQFQLLQGAAPPMLFQAECLHSAVGGVRDSAWYLGLRGAKL